MKKNKKNMYLLPILCYNSSCEMSDVMQKIKVKLKINDYALNTNGYLNNNILSFNDKDSLTTNIIYDINNDLLIRDNNDITIKIDFNNKIVEYFLKNEKYTLKQDIKIFKLHKNETSIIINYQIEENDFNLELLYEEEEI